MSAPATYADLGKAARDLFSKGFHFGQYKLEAKTKSSSGVEFTSNATSNHDSGAFTGSLETKYKWSERGVTFTEKWNTDNVLQSEISVEDQLLKGLKLSLDANFAPQSGKKGAKIKTAYKQEYVHANLDLDVFALTVHGAAVVGYKGFLAGYQLALDTSKTAKSLLSQSNFALGYSKDDLTLHTAIVNGNEYQGSVFHKITKELETGVQLSWQSGSHETRFGVGAKYTPDKDTTIRAKLNNASQFGLSYQHKVRDGVNLTLSTLVEGKNLNQGGHKFGIALDFEA